MPILQHGLRLGLAVVDQQGLAFGRRYRRIFKFKS